MSGGLLGVCLCAGIVCAVGAAWTLVVWQPWCAAAPACALRARVRASVGVCRVAEVVLRTYEQSYAYRVDRVRRVDRVILYGVSGCSRASQSWDVRRGMASVRHR